MSQQEAIVPLPPQTDDPAAWQVYSDQWSAYVKHYQDRAQDIKETEAWEDYSHNWSSHWRRCNQPQRYEPEIEQQRKEELALRRRDIVPNIEKGIYPFKEDMKLTRADIEWLLATHEDGRGPVDWHDVSQREREGLDLRGADLRDADLRHLPLARLRGGLSWSEWNSALPQQSMEAAIHMEKAVLTDASMEGAILIHAQLKGADLSRALLEEANLAHAQLKKAKLSEARLKKANLGRAQLKKADLSEARMEKANLAEAHLEGANLSKVEAEGVNFSEAWMPGADLTLAQLKGADLSKAHIQGAILCKAHLENANLSEAYLDDAKLTDVVLSDKEQRIGPQLVDVQWGNTNLSVVKWSQIGMLGDEYLAHQWKKKVRDGKVKAKDVPLQEYFEKAVRANRQLAVALQAQGLNEEASRFAYRAQKLQGMLFRLQRKFGKYLFFAFLDMLAGYGYKPGFTLLWYLGTLSVFSLLYLLFGHIGIPGAFILSLTSFHGRGFFPGNAVSPNDPILIGILAAFEAIIGLFIEISFIATFTQRFLGQ